MTDQMIQSNALSSLLRSLQNAGLQDVTYKMEPSFPNNINTIEKSISLTSDTPSGVSVDNRLVELSVPRRGFWRGCQLQVDYSINITNPAMTPDVPLGLVLGTVNIRTASSILYTQDTFHTLVKTFSAPPAVSLANLAMARVLSPTTGLPGSLTAPILTTTVFRSYVPIYWSGFGDDYTQAIDTSFCEQLQVTFQFGTNLENYLSTFNITGASVKLVNKWTLYDSDARKKWISSLSSSGGTMQILMRNSQLERKIIDVQGPSTQLRLLTNTPIENLFFGLRKIASGGVIVNLPGTFVPMQSFSLEINGSLIFNQISILELNYFMEKYSSASLRLGPITTANTGGVSTVLRSENSFGCISFANIFNSKNGSTGAFSTGGVSSLVLTVYSTLLSSEPANSVVLVVSSEYLQMLSLNPSNGSVARIIST
jgi:hypothetical protein